MIKRSLSFTRRGKKGSRLDEDSDGSGSNYANNYGGPSGADAFGAPLESVSSSGPQGTARGGGGGGGSSSSKGSKVGGVVRSLSFGRRKSAAGGGATKPSSMAYSPPYQGSSPLYGGDGGASATSLPYAAPTVTASAPRRVADQGREGHGQGQGSGHGHEPPESERRRQEQEDMELAMAMSMSMASLEQEQAHRGDEGPPAAPAAPAAPRPTSGSANDAELQRALELSRLDNRAPSTDGNLIDGLGGAVAPQPAFLAQPAPAANSAAAAGFGGDLDGLFGAAQPVAAQPVAAQPVAAQPVAAVAAVQPQQYAPSNDLNALFATPAPPPQADPFGGAFAAAPPQAGPFPGTLPGGGGFPGALSSAPAPTPTVVATPVPAADPFASLGRAQPAAAPTAPNPFAQPGTAADPFAQGAADPFARAAAAQPQGFGAAGATQASPFGAPAGAQQPFGAGGSNPFAGF